MFPLQLTKVFPTHCSCKSKAHKAGVSPHSDGPGSAQKAVVISPRLHSIQGVGFLTSKMNDQFPEIPKHPDIFMPCFISQSSREMPQPWAPGDKWSELAWPLARAFWHPKGRMWGKGTSRFSSWRGRSGPSRGGEAVLARGHKVGPSPPVTFTGLRGRAWG